MANQSAHNPFRTPNLTPNPTGALNAQTTGASSTSAFPAQTLSAPSADQIASSLAHLDLRSGGPSFPGAGATAALGSSGPSPFADPPSATTSRAATPTPTPAPAPSGSSSTGTSRPRSVSILRVTNSNSDPEIGGLSSISDAKGKDAALPPRPPRDRDSTLPLPPLRGTASGSVSGSGSGTGREQLAAPALPPRVAMYAPPPGPPPGHPAPSSAAASASSRPPPTPPLRSPPAQPRSPEDEYEEGAIPRITVDDLPDLPERPAYSPPPYSLSADILHGESTLEVGPRRPFQPQPPQPNVHQHPHPQQQRTGSAWGGYPGAGARPSAMPVQGQETGGSGWGGFPGSNAGPGSGGRHGSGGRTPVYLPPQATSPMAVPSPTSPLRRPGNGASVGGATASVGRGATASVGRGATANAGTSRAPSAAALSDFARDFYAAGANPPGVNLDGGNRGGRGASSSGSRRPSGRAERNANATGSPPSSDDEHYTEFVPPLQPTSPSRLSPSTSTSNSTSTPRRGNGNGHGDGEASRMPGAFDPLTRLYAPPPGPPPDRSPSSAGAGPAGRYAPPPGAPPQSPSGRGVGSGRGGNSGASNSDIPDDGRPTKIPMGGHPLLLNEKILVYPTGYECQKCHNTGFKAFDPSRPCSRCWDKYAQPYAGPITYAPWSSSSTTSPSPSSPSASTPSGAGKTFQRALPRQPARTPTTSSRPGHSYSRSASALAPPPPGSANLMRSPSSSNLRAASSLSSPSASAHAQRPRSAGSRTPTSASARYPCSGWGSNTNSTTGGRSPGAPQPPPPPRHPTRQESVIVRPGDPRIGGRLCWDCGGDGVVSVFFFDESTCRTCGGVGRVF